MKILRIACYGAFALILGLAGVIFLGLNLPYVGQIEIKIVKSGSMEPAIMTGGIVALVKSPAYAVGDVITFDAENSDIPTTHRIIGTETVNGVEMFVTKGDANEERDNELALPAYVRGKVLFTLPYVGFILDFARKPLGFTLLIALPALLIIIDEIEKIWREMRTLRQQKRDAPPVSKNKLPTARIASVPLIVSRPLRRSVDIRKRVHKSEPVPIEAVQKPAVTVRDVAVTACAVLVLNALIFSSATIGSTVSYFNDTESSTGNTFTASAIDFTVETDGNSYGFQDGIIDEPDGAVVQVVSPETGSSPARYELSVEFANGTQELCNAVIATVSEPFIYNGPLATLSASGVLFDDPWSLGLTLGAGVFEPGTFCSINFVYRAYHTDAEGNTGYTDEEKVPLTLTILTPAPVAPEAFERTLIETEANEDSEDIFVPTDTTDASITPPADEEVSSIENEVEEESTEEIIIEESESIPAADETSDEEPVAEIQSEEVSAETVN